MKRSSTAIDLTYLVKVEATKWKVNLPFFISDGEFRDIHALRDILQTMPHIDTIPDDLLKTAARFGALVSLPFLDILDGDGFHHEVCLCCCKTKSTVSAREAVVALRLFCQYYDARSYLDSRAFIRTVAILSRDLSPGEVVEISTYISSLDSTQDAVREINVPGPLSVCVATPTCQPGTLWVYSTSDGRRLLRHLSRNAGAPVKITVASSYPTVYPRFRYRMYAAKFVSESSDSASLLEMALAWSRMNRKKS